MRKEALLPQQWQVQPQQTALFRFETTDSSQLVAIRIAEKTSGKARQIITSNTLAEVKKDSVLRVYDYNFDGQPDFSFGTWQEGDDAISSYRDYYIYDAASGLFIKDSLLSTQANLRFDPVTGTANSTITGSRQLSKEVQDFRYVQGRWQLVYIQSSDCKVLTEPCTVTERKWLQGQWEQQTSKQKREIIFPE